MNKEMFLICLLTIITTIYAGGDKKTLPANEKITLLMNQIDLVTNEVVKLRVKTTCMESSIRSSIKGFENFQLLDKIPTKMNRGARKIKSNAVTAQLAEAEMTSQEKAIYHDAVLHLFDLEHEGMVLDSALAHMETIIAAHNPTEDQSNWCLLL